MEIKTNMTDLSFSRWVAIGALALTAFTGFSRSLYAQSEAVQPADQAGAGTAQEVLLAKTMPEPNAAAVEPFPTASANAKPAPPPPSSGYSWTGFYVGVNVGYGTGNADTFINPLPTPAIFVNLKQQTLSPDPSGPLGGAQMGYNWQKGHFVLGVEGDIDAASIDGTFVQSPIIQNNGTPFPGTGNNLTVHQRTDAISTVRPRIGFVLGSRILVYGTGGLAIAHVGYTANTDFRPIGTESYPANFSKTKTAVIYGGGAEFSIGGNWTAKGEYLLYDAGSESFVANPALPLPPFQVAYTWQTKANLFRFGVNYRF